MRCLNCQYDNPDEAKFCGECGTKLEIKCQSCGKENPPTNKFCYECGHRVIESVRSAKAINLGEPQVYIPDHLAQKILGGKSNLEGERKQVTALFADIHSFTELAENLDPEEVRSLINKCFEIVIEEVHRFEGTINQFAGDGVLALFGAPLALEDHPYRAVNAAIAIQGRLKTFGDKLKREDGIDLRMRVGLNTGLVVVGSIGNDLRMDYTAIGDTINLASRLQSLADPGKILISENTHKLVSGYFLTRPIGEFKVKGKYMPVKMYEVIRARSARTRIDVEVEQGLTPFTGRDRELGILKDCLIKTKEGSGQIVLVIGEAGVGKSRLLLEYREMLSGEDMSWLEGRCLSFGGSVSYLPLVEILKRGFRIDESDSEDEIIRKVEEGTLLLGNDLKPTIPYFKYLLSVDPGEASILSMDAQQRKAQTFEALRKVILRGSQIRPLVLVIEDLHWIGKTSEEFLVFLADSIATAPVLMLLTYRPDYSHPLGERTYHTRIVLNNLTREESVRMAERLLETSGLPDEIRELIHKKAEGNPFFIEEVTKSLLESGIIVRSEGVYKTNKNLSRIEIPSTIQDIIMARIDRLDENRKRTLQVGSVIGREFSFELIQKVLDDKGVRDHLLALRNSELIYEKGFSPNVEYVFKHALTHDVAYGSLLVQKRKELHDRVGSAIEELYSSRLEEFYEVLAHHFNMADNREKAFYYLTMAGKKAKEIFATEESLKYFEGALKRLDEMPRTEINGQRKIDVLLEVENIYDNLAKREEQKIVLERVIDISKAINDKKRLSDGYIKQAEFLSVMGEYQKAKEVCRTALTLKKTIGDKVGVGKALRGMGFIHWRSGEYDDALKYHQEALGVHRELGDNGAEGFELISLGEVYRKLGHYDDALLYLQEAFKVHKGLGIKSGQHVAAFNIGIVYQDMGDYQACLEYYQECWRTVKEIGLSSLNTYSNFIIPISIANAYWRLGNYQESLRHYREALEISRGMRDRFEEGNVLSYMAAIYSIIEDYQESINHYEEALKIYKEVGDKALEGKVITNIGNIYRQNLRAYREALLYYKEGLEVKREIGEEDEVRSVLNSLGVVCWNLGLFEESLAYYKEALEVCKKTGDKIGEGITLSGMSVVCLSLHRYEEALNCNWEALNLLKATGDQKIEGYILNSVGNTYYQMGDYQRAWKYYQESLRIRKELGDKRGEAWVLHNLGKVYWSLKNYGEAKQCYEEALHLAQELGEEELIVNSENALSEIKGMN